MKRSLLLFALAGVLYGEDYTPQSFDQALTALDAQIDADVKAAISSMPTEWNVATQDGTYAIPSSSLRAQLKSSDKAGAHRWIAQVREHLRASEIQPKREVPDASETLHKILARPEFKPPDPPTFWQRLWSRIAEWIGDLVGSIFRYAAEHPTGSQVLFWTLIAGSVAALGFWLYRLWTTQRIPSTHAPQPIEGKVQGHAAWLQDARAAAAAGDTREAIRCAYWAAVTRLQQDRALNLSYADTPRERLRQLQESGRAGRTLEPALMQPLRNITQEFERAWYANRGATTEDADRSLKDAEALGCRAE